MRTFSEFEKEVLKYIVKQGSKFRLYNLIKSDFIDSENQILVYIGDEANVKETFTIEENDLVYIIRKKDDKVPDIEHIKNKIIEIVILLKYLESSYLCSLYETGVFTFYTDNVNRLNSLKEDDGLAAVFYEKTYYEFIRKNIYSSFYITSELKDIIDHDFKTKEQRYIESQISEAKLQTTEAKKQTTRAGYSLIISGVALLAAIISIIISISKVSSKNDDSSQTSKMNIVDIENEITEKDSVLVDSLNFIKTKSFLSDSLKKMSNRR